jgi:hypothetical protein
LIHNSIGVTVEKDRGFGGRQPEQADASRLRAGGFMSNLKYAIVENEAMEQATKQQAGPYLVPPGERNGVSITRRAEEALDFELAQGSLPA